MPVSEAESGKSAQERADELLRTGRLVFLQTAGYTDAEITGLGDLAAVPSEKITGLLEKKAMDAAARFFIKEKVVTEPFHKAHKKRKKSRKR
jgi:hypothetical protein